MFKKLLLSSLVFLIAIGSQAYAQTPVAACSISFSSPEVSTSFTLNGTLMVPLTAENAPNAYLDQTNYVINASVGDSISFDIQGYYGYGGTYQYSHWLRIFIDANHNGVFTDAGELIYSGAYLTSHVGKFAIPAIASGVCRLRIYNDYSTPLASGCGTNTWGEARDFTVVVAPPLPKLLSILPEKDSVLRFEQVYNTAHKPSITYKRLATDSVLYFKYFIYGGLNGDTIYKATNPGSTTNMFMGPVSVAGDAAVYSISSAVGAATDYNSTTPTLTGNLNLVGKSGQVSGGSYIAKCQMYYANINNEIASMTNTFTIALEKDLACNEIDAPKSKDVQKYSRTSGSIPVRVRVGNVGLQTVTQYDIIAKITSVATGLVVRLDTIHFQNDSLKTGQTKLHIFNPFVPTVVGDYQIEFYAKLIAPIPDYQIANNYIPRVGSDPYIFSVYHDVDVKADTIIAPASVNFIGRPIQCYARMSNLGTKLVSGARARMIIYDPNGNIMSNQIVEELPDIPAGRYNQITAYFDQVPFIPSESGTYTAVFIVYAENDGVIANDTCRKTFQVVSSMCGKYTIGKQYENTDRNFNTMQEAVDALYRLGISCPVTFELTDSLYYIGNGSIGAPALDISSRIIGLGPINTLSIVPSDERANSPEGIKIQLNSATGVGILMGQNERPTNQLAPIYQVGAIYKRDYANNPDGATYITFDGGANKSLQFSVKSTSPSRAVFYLAQGTSNVTIRNCVITDSIQSPALKLNANLPYTRYNNSQSRIDFDPDFQIGKPLSVGVYLRTTPPLDPKTESNTNKLDTLPNKSNIIENNIITNFAYGIASIGMGPLKDNGEGIFKRYYNEDNKFIGNTIYNVGKTAIFLGFEENSLVKNNRIDSIISSQDVAGILAGLPSKDELSISYFGYHNVGIIINGNEVSNIITSNASSTGVKIEQARTGYPAIDPITHEATTVYFPDVDDNFTVINNVIWNATHTARITNRFGIKLSSERTSNQYIPKDKNYSVKGNKISNNTIIVSNNGSILRTKTSTAAIFLSQVTNSEVKNNAIALVDSNCTVQEYYAGLLFVGPKPALAGMSIDRNLIQFDTARISASWARFIETDSISTILEGSELTAANDYRSVEQWRNWTGMDVNSLNGKFMNDMQYVTSGRNTILRMVAQPSQGCLLEARGDRLSYVGTDMLGNLRGPANRRFDAGAFEFEGDMYEDDAEIISICAPAAWQATNGIFNDAEYVMTTSPVDVKAHIRNNSSKPKVGLVVRASIYRQNDDGTFPTTPTVGPISTTMGKIESAEISEVSFGLGDTAAAIRFMPASYTQLGLTAPARFNSMRSNVTPIYQIKIEIVDNQILNNTMKKNVRFYVKHSKKDWIISAENTNFNVVGATAAAKDSIAGRLNADSLINAFNNIGWTVYTPIPDSSWVDVFDRCSWEPKNVDYKNYRFVIWSDGDDKQLKRYELINIKDYLAAGTTALGGKKNIAIGSQEMLRSNYSNDYTFTSKLLNSDTTSLTNPLGTGVTNDGNRIVGKSVRTYFTDFIKSTAVANDPAPYCGVMKVFPGAEGDARRASVYKNKAVPAPGASIPDSAAGVTTRALTRNVVYLGIEWRHFKNLSDILLGIYDFMTPEDLLPPPAGPVPVELTTFKANYRNRNVEVVWATASEINTTRFEVERREDSEASFVKVAELKAVGSENHGANYGPVIDNSVLTGRKYHYRLRSVDVDGSFDYSAVETIDIPAASEWLGNAEPNPAMNAVKFEFNTNTNASKAEIYDFSGNLVNTIQIENGSKIVQTDVSNFTAGVYTIVLQAGDTVLRRQFVVVK